MTREPAGEGFTRPCCRIEICHWSFFGGIVCICRRLSRLWSSRSLSLCRPLCSDISLTSVPRTGHSKRSLLLVQVNDDRLCPETPPGSPRPKVIPRPRRYPGEPVQRRTSHNFSSVGYRMEGVHKRAGCNISVSVGGQVWARSLPFSLLVALFCSQTCLK